MTTPDSADSALVSPVTARRWWPGAGWLRRVVLMAGAGGANCCQFYIVDVTNIWENFSLEFVKLPP